MFCTYSKGRLLAAPREYILHGFNSRLNGGSCCSVSWALFLFVLAHPASCCSPQWLKFHAYPSRLAGQLYNKVQVNNTVVPHLMHTYTHIHITFALLSVSFFTLLPPHSAGRLAQTLPVWHNYCLIFLRESFHCWNCLHCICPVSTIWCFISGIIRYIFVQLLF
jgi:hypothetical protein